MIFSLVDMVRSVLVRSRGVEGSRSVHGLVHVHSVRLDLVVEVVLEVVHLPDGHIVKSHGVVRSAPYALQTWNDTLNIGWIYEGR